MISFQSDYNNGMLPEIFHHRKTPWSFEANVTRLARWNLNGGYGQQRQIRQKTIKTASEISKIDFYFVTLFTACIIFVFF